MRRGLRAFTLIELMLVMAIMGLLGTISIGGYRSMRRGMEESGVLRNKDKFVDNARERATIDRQPTAIYFWNELRRAESDTESLLVVGRAVAVRRAGRISAIDGDYLIDEFGDLRFEVGTNAKGVSSPSSQTQQEVKRFLYRVNGNESGFHRSTIGQTTVEKGRAIAQMMTDRDWTGNNGDSEVAAYGYYLDDKGGIDWKVGDAYGLEFAEITLPNNYIFGSIMPSANSPIATLNNIVKFNPGDGVSPSVEVRAIRPGSGGAPSAEVIKTKY